MDDKEYIKEQFDIAYHSGSDQAFIENMKAFISTYINTENEHGKALAHFIDVAEKANDIPGMLYGMINEAFNKLVESENCFKPKKEYTVESSQVVYYQHRIEAWTSDEAKNIVIEGLYKDEPLEFEPYDGDYLEITNALTDEEAEEEWRKTIAPIIADFEGEKNE